jgi:spermidine synthase
MPNYSVKFILLITAILLTVSLQHATAKVVHSERSLYRNIIVEDKGDLRCLKFNVKTTKTRQSCLYKSKPQQLVFNYTKQLLTALLVNPKPEQILIIGLGGGTMSNTLHQLFPQSHIDNVEIDESVIKVARQYFGFLENTQIKTYSQDGRVFVKRALLKKQAYDWIILDAFNGDYIPEHLMTAEFLEEIKALLSPQGILTANTFSSSKLYGYESATYKKVFGDFYQVTNSNNNNRIILAQKKGFMAADLIKGDHDLFNNSQLSSQLAELGVDSQSLFSSIKFTGEYQDWDSKSIILTDQFSPANLLNLEND